MRRVVAVLIILVFLLPLWSAEDVRYTIDDLIVQMEAGNADLLKSDQEVIKAHLDTSDAKGGYTPTVDLLLTGTFMANPTLGPIKVNPNDIKGLPDIVSQIWTDPLDVSMDMGNNMVQGQLTVTQPIFTWGKLSNAVKLYETVEGLRRMERTDKENQLIAELRSRLDALFYMDMIYPLLTSIEETADRLIAIAESAAEEGVLLEEDVLDARIQKQQVVLSRREIDSQYSSVLEGLRTLTGLSDLTMDQVDYTPDEEMIDGILSLSLEELTAAATSPSLLTLQMAKGMETVQGYITDIAKGSIYGKPDIALQLSASYGGSIDSNWLDGDTWGLNITLALSTTLWDGGKKMSDVKRAASDALSASIDYSSAVRMIEENVASAYSSAMLSRDKIEYSLLKEASESAKADRAEERMKIGTASESDVLASRLAVLQSQIETITERISLSQSAYTLMYLTAFDPSRVPVINDGMAK